jgi:hypothetical protein
MSRREIVKCAGRPSVEAQLNSAKDGIRRSLSAQAHPWELALNRVLARIGESVEREGTSSSLVTMDEATEQLHASARRIVSDAADRVALRGALSRDRAVEATPTTTRTLISCPMSTRFHQWRSARRCAMSSVVRGTRTNRSDGGLLRRGDRG